MKKLIKKLEERFDEKQLLIGDDVKALEPDWFGDPCSAFAVLFPRTTDEVSQCLRLCHKYRVPVVTQGGNTGVVGGTRTDDKSLLLSLDKMDQIEELDLSARTMTVQAGIKLQTVQEAARQNNLTFCLDLGARGSATIGGNIATNAGGNRVLRYGMMREQVLGIEVVLADGQVLNHMSKVLKDNTGYDWKHLFIGSEGTLGVITRAVLRLHPELPSTQTALLGLRSSQELAQLYLNLDRSLGGRLCAFEVMWQDFFILAASDKQNPLSQGYPLYVLVESEGADDETDKEQLTQAIEKLLRNGLIEDAVLAQSSRERDALWAIRDNIDALKVLDNPYSYDVSVPVSELDEYLNNLKTRLLTQFPGYRSAIFGHYGDSNIHLFIGGISDAQQEEVDEFVYGLLPPQSSISAEHGIGATKRAWLCQSRSPAEIEMMKQLKKTLDPKNILNPGKLFMS